MPPASPVGSPAEREVASILRGACCEMGGIYDWEGANALELAIWDPSEMYGYGFFSVVMAVR